MFGKVICNSTVPVVYIYLLTKELKKLYIRKPTTQEGSYIYVQIAKGEDTLHIL